MPTAPETMTLALLLQDSPMCGSISLLKNCTWNSAQTLGLMWYVTNIYLPLQYSRILTGSRSDILHIPPAEFSSFCNVFNFLLHHRTIQHLANAARGRSVSAKMGGYVHFVTRTNNQVCPQWETGFHFTPDWLWQEFNGWTPLQRRPLTVALSTNRKPSTAATWQRHRHRVNTVSSFFFYLSLWSFSTGFTAAKRSQFQRLNKVDIRFA